MSTGTYPADESPGLVAANQIRALACVLETLPVQSMEGLALEDALGAIAARLKDLAYIAFFSINHEAAIEHGQTQAELARILRGGK